MPNRIQHKYTASVLASADLQRDIRWYEEYTGFVTRFTDEGYVGLYRDGMELHLQWHAGTEDDPLIGGSVVKFFITNIDEVFKEFTERGTVKEHQLKRNTAWGTHEFGFYDLNKNAIFFVEELHF